MSGLEVAGIALAVFPVLVNGVNHIVEGIETIHRWKRYKLILKEYLIILESARADFLNTLDELLDDIVPSDEEVRRLLEEPGGPSWKKSEYDERLRRRLDRSYSSYSEKINLLTRKMNTMCEKLGIDKSGKVQWDSYSTVEREMMRLKLTFSRSANKELLDEICQTNRDLREVTHQNMALEPIKRKRRSKRSIVNLKLIRKHAASLYQVLMTDKAWKCTCKMCHMASLRLETRPQTIEEVRADIPQEFKFRVLLSVAEINDATLTSHWAEIEVIPSVESQVPIEKSPKTSMVHLAEPPRTVTRSVRFASEIDPVPVEALKAISTRTSLRYTQDLCGLLQTPRKSDREVGILVDEGGDKHEHRLYRADTIMMVGDSSKSLGEILGDSQRYSPDEGLLRRDRLQIAVTLASSVLQLDGTLWLKSQWTTNDIFFHCKSGQSGGMEYSSPYLSWQRCCNTEIPSLEQLRLSSHMIRSDVLLALGLALVELCFGRTLEDMRKPNDADINDTMRRTKTATRLLGKVNQEMGPAYGAVVRRCLFQPFDVQELSLEIEEVQQQVLDNIVTPLAVELNNFYNC